MEEMASCRAVTGPGRTWGLVPIRAAASRARLSFVFWYGPRGPTLRLLKVPSFLYTGFGGILGAADLRALFVLLGSGISGLSWRPEDMSEGGVFEAEAAAGCVDMSEGGVLEAEAAADGADMIVISCIRRGVCVVCMFVETESACVCARGVYEVCVCVWCGWCCPSMAGL